MVLRRLAVALLAVITPLVIASGPATAATYPPTPPAQQTTVAPGVVYGGSAVGATTISACSDQLDVSSTIQEGEAFLLKVCGFLPGSDVNAYVRPPSGGKVLIDTLAADGDGIVVAGPFRLTAPGRYVFYLAGSADNVTSLGGGGIGSRGTSKLLADPNRVVQVALTVPAAGDSALPRTGGDGGGHSAAVLGFGIGLAGAFLLLVAGVRRRAIRRHA
jgi:hypothetical protein